MALKDDTAVLLSKEMDRKEFLKYIGLGLVALTGLGAVIRAMTPASNQAQSSARGYGSAPYGGTKNGS